MTDAPEPEVVAGPTADSVEEEAESHPRGTFFLVLMFLLLIVVLWFWTYGVLIERGA